MSFATTLLLGAIAGFTIFLGLPVARMRNVSRALQAFLNAVATGILVFLFWDVITKATEPIGRALDDAHKGSAGMFLVLLAVFVVGLSVGLMGLVYFERRMIRRSVPQG